MESQTSKKPSLIISITCSLCAIVGIPMSPPDHQYLLDSQFNSSWSEVRKSKAWLEWHEAHPESYLILLVKYLKYRCRTDQRLKCLLSFCYYSFHIWPSCASSPSACSIAKLQGLTERWMGRKNHRVIFIIDISDIEDEET